VLRHDEAIGVHLGCVVALVEHKQLRVVLVCVVGMGGWVGVIWPVSW
jgi:hypothetical protein